MNTEPSDDPVYHVRGAILDGGQTLRSAPADACSVTYDPYMAGAFTAAGRGVRAAARVWFGADGKVRAAGTEFLP